jgi:hypothetical protein
MIDFGFVWLIKMFYMHSNFYLILRSQIGVIALDFLVLDGSIMDTSQNFFIWRLVSTEMQEDDAGRKEVKEEEAGSRKWKLKHRQC